MKNLLKGLIGVGILVLLAVPVCIFAVISTLIDRIRGVR